ncbi:MAG: hypothetical protein QM496_10660 [Verrucomicrobiota bacterium]
MRPAILLVLSFLLFACEGNEKKVWKTFNAGVTSLQDKGDRKYAAKLFRKVSVKFSESHYAKESKELAELLENMAREDSEWRESKDVKNLSLEKQIDHWIYHLRNVNCYQHSQPGMCYLLQDFGQREGIPNAAIKLKEIGQPAIPALVKLLDDRRPTRSVGFWRHNASSRTILRYQDAAIQILNELTTTPFYRRSSTGSYFSNENSEIREKTIASITSWYLKSRGKSEVEQKWIAIEEDPGIYQILILLDMLAEKHGQKEQVLEKLREMCNTRDPYQLPQLSSLMCQLGDNSKLATVTDAYLTGGYNFPKDLPDDGAADSNAQDYALRQMILYGSEKYQAEIRKRLFLKNKENPLSKRGSAIIEMLCEIAYGGRGGLPKGYTKAKFPMHLLIDALDFRDDYAVARDGKSEWTIRRCDAVAEAIQIFTGIGFSYDEKAPIATKDVAIEKIRSWWRDQGMQNYVKGKPR